MSNELTSAVLFDAKFEEALTLASNKEKGLVREFDILNEYWGVAYLNDPWYDEELTNKQLASLSTQVPLLHYFYDEGIFEFSGYIIYSKGKKTAFLSDCEDLYLIESENLSHEEINIVTSCFDQANPSEFINFPITSVTLEILTERLNKDYIIKNWHEDIIIDIHEWLPNLLNIQQVSSNF